MHQEPEPDLEAIARDLADVEAELDRLAGDEPEQAEGPAPS